MTPLKIEIVVDFVSKEQLIEAQKSMFWGLQGYLLIPTAEARDRGLLQSTLPNKNCSV